MIEAVEIIAKAMTLTDNQMPESYQKPKPVARLDTKILKAYEKVIGDDPTLQFPKEVIDEGGAARTPQQKAIVDLVRAAKSWVI